LMTALKNYAQVAAESEDAKERITVGVIGFPNVGKSSIIGSLKRCRAPGSEKMTKTKHEINLGKNIVLLATPAVVQTPEDQPDSLILRSVVRVEDIADPIRPVTALLKLIEKSEILKFYRIGDFKTTEEFLGQVARKRGFQQAAGVGNTFVLRAARAVLRDYMGGRLRFHTTPPAAEDLYGSEEDDDVEMK